MGALHEGHLSLIRGARCDCGFVGVSVFVNPLQFGPGEDFRRYPRDVARDKKILQKQKVDMLFYPRAAALYGKSFSTFVEETRLSNCLCGLSRPGHFRGVCTVVAKLFNIIQPDIAYFGQKDYQQAQVIKKMASDLNFPLKIKILPTVREKDSVAMSSRNLYLRPAERLRSRRLYQALVRAKKLIDGGERNAGRIIGRMKRCIRSGGERSIKIDYVEIRKAEDLTKVFRIRGKVLIALAVYVGGVRLIDNIIVDAG
jgi:pantoate--beta-alanine ligase